MREKITVILSIFCIFLIGLAISGQTKKEILTNEKIIELVRLGLGEAIVIEKIRQSDCQCDTSTMGLAKLKAAKVSDGIIMAMMGATANKNNVSAPEVNKSSAQIEKKTVSPETTKATLSQKESDQLSEPGIYLYENGVMKTIEPTVFNGGKINPFFSAMTYGIMKTKYRAKIRGKSANLQTSSSQPIFYFVFNPDFKESGATMAGLFWGMPATSPNEFVLAQMDVKSNSREAVLGEYGAWTGVSMGTRDKDVREFSFEKIEPGIYRVVPKVNLTSGEYCFYFAANVANLGFAGNKIFDFNVK